jgi:glyoxylase-like metal-dependent hydrolase (beta-lactamase superfamily II)
MATVTGSPAVLDVETFRAPGDGCLGYLIVDEMSRTALAVDPRLDLVDRFQDALTARGLRLAYALDTHTHADHLSGVRMLARRTGADVLAHTGSRLAGAVRRVKGGETLALGARTVTVMGAPGHTPDSLAILVDGHLFTGDALFVGGADEPIHGWQRLGSLDTFRTFERLSRRHDRASRARLCRSGGTTHRREKAHNSLPRARPCGPSWPGSPVGAPAGQHGGHPASQPRRG